MRESCYNRIDYCKYNCEENPVIELSFYGYHRFSKREKFIRAFFCNSQMPLERKLEEERWQEVSLGKDGKKEKEEEEKKRLKQIAENKARHEKFLRQEAVLNRACDYVFDGLRIYLSFQILFLGLEMYGSRYEGFREWNRDVFEKTYPFEAKFFGFPGYWAGIKIFDSQYEKQKSYK